MDLNKIFEFRENQAIRKRENLDSLRHADKLAGKSRFRTIRPLSSAKKRELELLSRGMHENYRNLDKLLENLPGNEKVRAFIYRASDERNRDVSR